MDERLSRLVRRKVAMLCAFTVGFEKVSKSCLLVTSRDFARFNWHSFAKLLAWRSMLWLSMTWRQKYLEQKYFLSITSLTWTLALHLLFCSIWSLRNLSRLVYSALNFDKKYCSNCVRSKSRDYKKIESHNIRDMIFTSKISEKRLRFYDFLNLSS